VTGSERSTIVATVLGVLFAVMVGMVAVTVVAVFVYKRKKRKQVVLHHTAMLNPVYEGKELGTKLLNIYHISLLKF